MRYVENVWLWMVDHPVMSIVIASIINGLITQYFGVETV